MTRHFSYTAVFEPAPEGGFVVIFPAIPGLATHGETLDEAHAMAADCLRAYLESLALDGEPVPYEAPGRPQCDGSGSLSRPDDRTAGHYAARLLRALQRGGFFIHHTSGSRHLLKHSGQPALRVVAHITPVTSSAAHCAVSWSGQPNG